MSKTPLQTLRLFLAGLACATWVFPLQAFATDKMPATSANKPLVRDVALGEGGRIAGQFVNTQGQPQKHQVLVVQRQGGEVKQLRTDADGRFELRGMSAGLYQVATADSTVVCRCWSERTAPPAATQELLIVSGEGIQRGQRPAGDILFSGPVLIALVIAAAIAIPIAIHNSQDAS